MLLFETAQAEEAHDFHVRMYADNRMAITNVAQQFRCRVDRQDAGTFYFDDYENTMDARFAVHPMGYLLVSRLSRGTYDRSIGSVREQFRAGDVFLVADPELPWSCRLHDARTQMIGLDADVVAKVAGVDRVRFTGYVPRTPALTRRWERTLDFVAADAGDVAEPGAPALVVTALGQLLAATLLSVFPNDVRVEPTVVDRHDAHPRTLRRAVAFIEAHPERDITVTEIAQAAAVTPRAIQLAFRRYLGTTPTAYLKLVRLHQAHRDLLAADAARGDRVVNVAARWGFTGMSRFAADYRAVFGQQPSHTLRTFRGVGGLP